MPTVVFRELVVAIASYVLCSSNFRKLASNVYSANYAVDC